MISQTNLEPGHSLCLWFFLLTFLGLLVQHVMCMCAVQFIRKHRPPVMTFDDALRDVKQEMCLV